MAKNEWRSRSVSVGDMANGEERMAIASGVLSAVETHSNQSCQKSL